MTRSVSTNSHPSRAASTRPTVVLPVPMNPVSTTLRSDMRPQATPGRAGDRSVRPVSETPTTWVVRARNLPEHAGNPIHTDAGARAEGFPSALVAGVTTYAYLTHPLVAAWGLDWLTRGGGEVRF